MAVAWRARPTANGTEHLAQLAPIGETSRKSSGEGAQEWRTRRRIRTFVQLKLGVAPRPLSFAAAMPRG